MGVVLPWKFGRGGGVYLFIINLIPTGKGTQKVYNLYKVVPQKKEKKKNMHSKHIYSTKNLHKDSD